MPETSGTPMPGANPLQGAHPYPQLLMRILASTYAQHPWRGDGEDIPIDIVLDESGVLPVWWNQIEKAAILLDIPVDRLPAGLVEDPQAITGKRLVWKETDSDLSLRASSFWTTEDYLFRALLPALAMDAVHVLHQQENILAQPDHLGMFSDENALTKNLVCGLSTSALITPCREVVSLPLQDANPDESHADHKPFISNDLHAEDGSLPNPFADDDHPAVH